MQQQVLIPARLMTTSQNTSRDGNVLTIPLKQINTGLNHGCHEGFISTNVAGSSAELKYELNHMLQSNYIRFSQRIKEELTHRKNHDVHYPKLLKMGLDAVHPVDKSYPIY